METEHHDQSFIGNSSTNKRRKLDAELPGPIESKCPMMSLPPPNIEKTNADCPLMKLPIDLRSQIIARVPIAQWHALELVDPNFREATLLAWRSLRAVDLDDFLINANKKEGESALECDVRSLESILKKLNDCAPFLTTLRKLNMQAAIPELNLLTIACLAHFEHLEMISLGDGQFVTDKIAIKCPIQYLVLFLETTRSRSTLKHISVDNLSIDNDRGGRRAMSTFTRRFSELVFNDRGTKDALALQTFCIDDSDCTGLNIGFVDVSNLTELRFGSSRIKPQQLTSLIGQATNLISVSFAFLHCSNDGDYNCGGNGLLHNTDLLKALASREKLTMLDIDQTKVRPSSDTLHGHCMRFETEFLDMLKALGRRECFDDLSLFADFVSPKFDWSRLIATISEHILRLRSLTICVDDCTAHDLRTIAKMKYLEDIGIFFTGDDKQFYEITDGFFQQLGAHKRLKEISLGRLAREDEHPLRELAKLSTLTEVTIMQMDSVRKEDYVAWSEGHLSNLESLGLYGVGVLDKDAELGLITLIEKTPQLRELYVEGSITDRFLNAIAESCGPKLTCLSVTSDEISIGALQMIIDRCPKLELGGLKNSVWKQLKFPRYRKARSDSS